MMTEFINTIDVVGDEALVDSIIDRSIAELKDNTLETIGNGAFWLCSSLANVDLPAVTSIGTCAFSSCVKLTMMDLPAVTSIGWEAFAYCNSMATLILRANTVSTLINANAFLQTPISRGTGFIFVPDNLVHEYAQATNWSTYAAQIRPLSELEE